MGYNLGVCPQCNNVMSMPDDSAIVRCPTCQAEVNAAEAAALAGSNGQVGGQQQPQPQDPYSNAINTSFQASEYTAPAGTAPFLGIWKTNVLFTVLGVLAGMAINGFTGSAVDTEGNYTGGAMVGVLALAYLIFTIVYAAKIYPSYFSDKPMISSSEAVSFLNTFCGGIIFGLLWNHNLTLKNKGISNVVFIVLIAVEFVLVFLAAFALVGAVASGAIS